VRGAGENIGGHLSFKRGCQIDPFVGGWVRSVHSLAPTFSQNIFMVQANVLRYHKFPIQTMMRGMDCALVVVLKWGNHEFFLLD